MERKIPESIKIQCGNENCKNIIQLKGDDFEYFEESYEREMGSETLFQYSKTFECPQCGKTIKVVFQPFEYPEGVLNDDSNPFCDGGVILNCSY